MDFTAWKSVCAGYFVWIEKFPKSQNFDLWRNFVDILSRYKVMGKNRRDEMWIYFWVDMPGFYSLDGCNKYMVNKKSYSY